LVQGGKRWGTDYLLAKAWNVGRQSRAGGRTTDRKKTKGFNRKIKRAEGEERRAQKCGDLGKNRDSHKELTAA